MPAKSPLPDFDRKALLGLVSSNYSLISRNLLGPLLELLRLSREACGGDMDKFLIMLVVAIRTTEHERFASYSQSDLLSGALPVFPTLGTNVRSVAESIGAPKETIRRKVTELVAAGWIARQDNELRFTARAYKDLARERLAIARLAVHNFEVVTKLTRAARSAP